MEIKKGSYVTLWNGQNGRVRQIVSNKAEILLDGHRRTWADLSEIESAIDTYSEKDARFLQAKDRLNAFKSKTTAGDWGDKKKNKEWTDKLKAEDKCGYFAACPNKPTKTVQHPILGELPVCEQCYDRATRKSSVGKCAPGQAPVWHDSDYRAKLDEIGSLQEEALKRGESYVSLDRQIEIKDRIEQLRQELRRMEMAKSSGVAKSDKKRTAVLPKKTYQVGDRVEIIWGELSGKIGEIVNVNIDENLADDSDRTTTTYDVEVKNEDGTLNGAELNEEEIQRVEEKTAVKVLAPGQVDEGKWDKAIEAIKKSTGKNKGDFGDSEWAQVNSVYQNMGGKFKSKKDSSVKTAAKEYAIWGVPKGQQEETLLLTAVEGVPLKDRAEAEKYKAILEQKYGATKTRIQELDLSQELEWDARKMVNPPSKWKRPAAKKTAADTGDPAYDMGQILFVDAVASTLEREYEDGEESDLAGVSEKLGYNASGQELTEYIPDMLTYAGIKMPDEEIRKVGQELIAAIDKKWAGKLTVAELLAEFPDVWSDLALGSQGHGVSPEDDRDVEAFMKSKGVSSHGLYMENFGDSMSDTAWVLLNDFNNQDGGVEASKTAAVAPESYSEMDNWLATRTAHYIKELLKAYTKQGLPGVVELMLQEPEIHTWDAEELTKYLKEKEFAVWARYNLEDGVFATKTAAHANDFEVKYPVGTMLVPAESKQSPESGMITITGVDLEKKVYILERRPVGDLDLDKQEPAQAYGVRYEESISKIDGDKNLRKYSKLVIDAGCPKTLLAVSKVGQNIKLSFKDVDAIYTPDGQFVSAMAKTAGEGRHPTTKSPTDPTFNKDWSGVSNAPHAKGKTCPDCGEPLHKESDSFYCPSCDDYKAPKEGRASKTAAPLGTMDNGTVPVDRAPTKSLISVPDSPAKDGNVLTLEEGHPKESEQKGRGEAQVFSSVYRQIFGELVKANGYDKLASMLVQKRLARKVADMEAPASLDISEVKQKAKELGLKVSIQTLSWGPSATISDTKSKASTRGNVFDSSPETKDFLARLQELKSWVAGRQVTSGGQRVRGLSASKHVQAKLRPENQRMRDFLSQNGVEAAVKYISMGSMKGTWRLQNPVMSWTPQLREKLTGLGFVDFDGRPLNDYSGNGGKFSVFVRGHSEMLDQQPSADPADIGESQMAERELAQELADYNAELDTQARLAAKLGGLAVQAATNDQVIEMFISDSFPKDKMPAWGTPNLKIMRMDKLPHVQYLVDNSENAGWVLENYHTPIMFRNPQGELFFNTQKYSQTTTIIQNKIRQALENAGVQAQEGDESTISSAMSAAVDALASTASRLASKLKRLAVGSEGRYKSDEDIASEFSGMTIENIGVEKHTEGTSWLGGDITIHFPEAGESVAGGQEGDAEVYDSWIFYNYEDWKAGLSEGADDPEDGSVRPKIAFNGWYPDPTYFELRAKILEKLLADLQVAAPTTASRLSSKLQALSATDLTKGMTAEGGNPGKKEVFTLDVYDETAEEGLDGPMAVTGKSYYSYDEALTAAKKLAKEYYSEPNMISITVYGGEFEDEKGDVYGEPVGLITISNHYGKPRTSTLARLQKKAARLGNWDWDVREGATWKLEASDDGKQKIVRVPN